MKPYMNCPMEWLERWPHLFDDRVISLHCPFGWRGVVSRTLDKLSDGCRVAQIKEKFGGLRLYTDMCTDADDRAIQAAETACWFVCQDCGSSDESVNTEGPGWVRTLCGACRVRRSQ